MVIEDVLVDPSRLYTLPEIGELSGAGYDNCYRWVRRGYLPARRLGDLFVVTGDTLLAFQARVDAGELEPDKPYHGSLRKFVAAK